MKIMTKQFQILTNVNLVWDFLTDIYDRETGSGVAAPFFEYALQSSWMDPSYSFLDRFWLDGDRIVAFVFYEAPVTDIFFSVRKRDSFLSILAAVDFVKEHFGIEMEKPKIVCGYSAKNNQCLGARCPFSALRNRDQLQNA